MTEDGKVANEADPGRTGVTETGSSRLDYFDNGGQRTLAVGGCITVWRGSSLTGLDSVDSVNTKMQDISTLALIQYSKTGDLNRDTSPNGECFMMEDASWPNRTAVSILESVN